VPLAIAEVPGVIAVWADPANYRPRPPNAPPGGYDRVIIHITSGRADPYGPARMWQKPLSPATSAHFVTGQNGVRLQCVPLRFAALHAHAQNGRSVGVEHCVREPGAFGPSDPGMPPTPALYRASAELVAYLLKAAGLAPLRGITILGHAESDPATTHTGCPNDGPWDWPRYMALVGAEHAKLGTIAGGSSP
jgi:hypothetical protein